MALNYLILCDKHERYVWLAVCRRPMDLYTAVRTVMAASQFIAYTSMLPFSM